MTAITPSSTMNPPLPHKPELLIGLVGAAGSGKDTVANMLAEQWRLKGCSPWMLSIAEPIRSMIHEFLFLAGVQDPSHYMDDRAFKERVIPEVGVSYRHLVQTLGTEWGQQCIGRDVWIKLLAAQMREVLIVSDHLCHFVISDVRFAAEADWLRAHGGVIWRIDRPGLAPVREHASELGMEQIRSDRVILNDGSLEELRRTVGLELARLHYEKGLAP